MIVSRTPLRVSLFGGGTDFPEYFENNPGGVLTFALDKYMHICLNKTNAHDKIKLMYTQIEFDDVNNLKHDIARNTLQLSHYIQIAQGLEIASFADLPTVGTGLGSSSAYAVGLIAALDALVLDCAGKVSSSLGYKFETAHLACKVEIEKCKSNIGIQDQYGCALPGLKFLKFNSDNMPIEFPLPHCNDLVNNLFLIYTGMKRSANEILAEQSSNINKNTPILNKMYETARYAFNRLDEHSFRAFDEIGELLNETWELKKSLSSSITNQHIDELYRYGLANGAIGGKLLGAGAGGYLLFYVPERNHGLFKSIMNPLTDFQAGLDHEGVRSYVIS